MDERMPIGAQLGTNFVGAMPIGAQYVPPTKSCPPGGSAQAEAMTKEMTLHVAIGQLYGEVAELHGAMSMLEDALACVMRHKTPTPDSATGAPTVAADRPLDRVLELRRAVNMATTRAHAILHRLEL